MAFWQQFEACSNGAFELHSGSRQERWGDVRVCACVRACVTVRGGGGRAVGLNSNQVERAGDRASVMVLVQSEGAGNIGDVHLVTHHHCKNLARC